MLLALATWLYPIKVAGTPKVETQIESSRDYTSGPLVIKDDAIQPTKPLDTIKPPSPILQRQSVRTYSGRNYTKEEVIQLIKDYSTQYGINAEVPLCIAKLESGYNQFSENSRSTASGIFQYLTGTWMGTDEGRAKLSVFDAEANVKAAIKYMASRNNTQPWVVNNKCPQLTSNK